MGEELKEEIIEEPSRKEARKSKKAKKGSTGAERGMVRLFINVGRKQRVQAKDIVCLLYTSYLNLILIIF